MESNKGGISLEQIKKLGDKKIILENLSWKPDQKFKNGKRLFFPYLDIKFVKSRMIEVCGPGNVQFYLEKDQDKFAIGRMGVFIEGEWVYNTAIGTERDSKLKDEGKRNKVIFKGNHSDAYKSCAELFGLIVPREVASKTLDEKEDKVVYSAKGKKIGHIEWNKESVNAYLNNLNKSITMLAQVYSINKDEILAHPDIDQKIKDVGEFLKQKGL
jgi:hypothetical protein